MAEDIFSSLERFIAAEILKQPGRSIAGDEALLSGGLIDSFHLVDLALFIEDTWGVRIEDSELNTDLFDTLDQLVALVEARRNKA